MHRDGLPRRASKVIVLGDSCVGKTSLILQLSKAQFNPLVEPTIGTAYISSRIPTSRGECPLNIWDTAGHERLPEKTTITSSNRRRKTLQTLRPSPG
jgi:small GTP-binding protein